MRKLLIIGPGSVHTQNFAELMKPVIEEVRVITDGKKLNGELRDTGDFTFSFRLPWQWMKSYKKMRAFIQNFKPEIIHIHEVGTHGLMVILAARRMKVPVVVTAWGSDILINSQKGFFYRQMIRYIVTHASAVTADATYVGKRMKELAGKPLNVLWANFGTRLTIGSFEKENWIFSNRLHKPLYRIDTIIKEFAVFCKEYPDWRLIIAGEGEGTASLKELATSLGIHDKVQFTGWLKREDNSRFLLKSKIFVSIPSSDGTSVSLLEAMEAGCFPVVSDLPANREWITDGINGRVADQFSGSLFSGIMELDWGKALNINNQKIAEHGTAEANRKKFYTLYCTLATAK